MRLSISLTSLILSTSLYLAGGIITVPTSQPDLDIQLPYPLVSLIPISPITIEDSAPQNNIAIGGQIVYYTNIYRPSTLVVPTVILGPQPPTIDPGPSAYIQLINIPTYIPPSSPPSPIIPNGPTESVPEPSPAALILVGLGIILIGPWRGRVKSI